MGAAQCLRTEALVEEERCKAENKKKSAEKHVACCLEARKVFLQWADQVPTDIFTHTQGRANRTQKWRMSDMFNGATVKSDLCVKTSLAS